MSNEKKENNRITHPEYGTGTILQVKRTEVGYWVTVYFDEVGEKKLLSFVDPTKETVKQFRKGINEDSFFFFEVL